MKPLISCLKKFGKSISPSDSSFITALRQEYIDSGLSGDDASNKALSEWQESINENIKSIELEIQDGGGSVPEISLNLKPKTLNENQKRAVEQGYIVNFHQLAEDHSDGRYKSDKSRKNIKPFTFYHGTASEFESFDQSHKDKNDGGWLGQGSYFYSDKTLALVPAKKKEIEGKGNGKAKVMGVHLKFNNPYFATIEEKNKMKSQAIKDLDAPKKLTAKLIKNGHDAVVLEVKPGKFEVMIIDPSHIRSVKAKFDNDKQSSKNILLSQKNQDRRSVLVRLFETIASKGDNFKYNKAPDSKDIGDIVSVMSKGIKNLAFGYESNDNEKDIYISVKDLKGSIVGEVSIQSNLEGNKYALINTEKGGHGALLYQMVMAWAHNNNVVLHPDNTLTEVNYLRRTEAMISSALRFKTTKHLRIHESQLIGLLDQDAYELLDQVDGEIKDVTPAQQARIDKSDYLEKQQDLLEQWKTGSSLESYESNLDLMLKASSELAHKRAKELKDYEIDKQGRLFKDKTTEITPKRFNEVALGSELFKAGVGYTTAQRAILTRQYQSHEQQSAFLDNYEDSLPESAARRIEGADDLYDSRDRMSDSSMDALAKSDGLNQILYRTSGKSFKVEGKETFTDRAIRYVQNKFLPLKKVQEAIMDGGTVITDEMNTYVKEELMHDKASGDLEKMQEKYVEPIVKKLAEYGITQEELDLFLYSKHAPERNAFIADRNNDLPEGGSGMTDQQAADNIKGFESFGKLNELEELSKIVYEMLNDKTKRLNLAGTLSDAQRESWASNFKFYVPLKGFQEDGGKDETAYVGKSGKGFNIKGRESMRALGRRTMSASPFLTAIQDSTGAILRARKNEVSQSFLELVKTNPNQGYWSIHTEENPGTHQHFDAQTNQVIMRKNDFYSMSPETGYFGVKVKGKQIFIKLEDERLLKAMSNLGAEPMTGIIKFMGKATRVLSALNTSLNPEFMISNMARDIQTAVFNGLAEGDIEGGKLKSVLGTKSEVLAFVAKMAKPTVIFGAMKGINSAIKDGDAKGKWQDHWRDFREQGAKTGYFDMKTPEEQRTDIENLVKIAEGGFEGNARKFSKATFEVVDRINTSVENAVRLSAYVHAVEAGLSKQKAASLAKNLTVNFNRKGEITWLNAIYMFGNASVQGTAQFIRSVGNNPLNHPSGKIKLSLAQQAALTMSMAGYMMALMGRELGGEDEDGEKWIDKVPDYVAERNFVIMKSVFGGKEDGSYWTIPLPYGYNVFHNIGSAIEGVQNGSNRKNLTWASRFVTFSALGSFSPIGMSTSEKGLETALIKTATPTLFKPFIEMGFDENFFGSSIYRNNSFDKNTRPDSYGKRNTNPQWKAISGFLNELTGGNHFEPGFVDIAPESFRHLITSYSGGLGRLADNTVGIGLDLSSGKDIEDRKIPFFRKVSGKVSGYNNINDFYDRKDKVNQSYEQFKSLKGKDKIFYRRENKNKIGLYALGRATEKRLKSLRKRRKAIQSQNHPSMDVKLKRIQELMEQAVTNFNKKYNQLGI